MSMASSQSRSQGKKVGTYDIDPAEIAPQISQQLLHDVVVMYQANAAAGTHRTKDRSDVAGTTKKMYRQKGPATPAPARGAWHRRGGGHVFALTGRDYSYRLPKKAVQAATRMAIAEKIEHDEVVVIDELALNEPKTKEMAAILQGPRSWTASARWSRPAEVDANVYKVPATSTGDRRSGGGAERPGRAPAPKMLGAPRRRIRDAAASAKRSANNATRNQRTTSARRISYDHAPCHRRPGSRLEPSTRSILRPLVTEKGMHRSTRNNQYAFEVDPRGDEGRRPPGGRGPVQRQGREGPHAEPPRQAAERTSGSPGPDQTGRKPS